MNEQGRWIVPTLLAPLAGLTVLASAFALVHAEPGEGIETWIRLMTFALIVAGVQSGVLAVCDLALAGLRVRRLPIGMRAWGAGAMAPLLALIAMLFLPFPHALLVLIVGCAIVAVPVRLLLGPRWRAP